MQNTVARALSERQLKDQGDVVPFLNKELIPLAREMRAALNLEGTQQFTLTTAATATFTTIWTSDDLRTGERFAVWTNTLASGAAQSCAYVRLGLFQNVAGAVSQVGATASIATIESAAAADVQFLVSGQAVLFQVKDDGVTTMAWKTTVTTLASDEV